MLFFFFAAKGHTESVAFRSGANGRLLLAEWFGVLHLFSTSSHSCMYTL